MKVVIIAIGIPASGKTTLLLPLTEKYGLIRISRDDIRQELFGDPLDRSDQERVWKEADEQMRQALSLGGSVVLDSTFVKIEKRLQAIQYAREAGAEYVIGLVFTTQLEVAQNRNRMRTHRVRDDTLDTSQQFLEENPPSLDDGFDALYLSDHVEELEAALSRLLA